MKIIWWKEITQVQAVGKDSTTMRVGVEKPLLFSQKRLVLDRGSTTDMTSKTDVMMVMGYLFLTEHQ